MSQKTLALIGAGRWGKNIITTLKQIEGVGGARLKYIVARNSESLEQYKNDYEVETDYKKLLEKKDIDVVIIATPPSTHKDISLPFIRAKIPVFIEKPLTANLEEAEAILKESKEQGGLVFVGHIHLYNPAYQKAKEFFLKAGKPRVIYGECGGNGPYRNDFSALWDWAPHDLSVMLDILGALPISVSASAFSVLRPSTKLYDVATLKLNFPNDVYGFIRVSWLLPIKQKRIMFVGENDSVVFDDVLSEKKVAVFKGMGPRIVEGQMGDIPSVFPNTPEIEYPEYSLTKPLEEELKAFLKAIDSGMRPPSDIAQGVAVVRILNAAERSIESGGGEIRLIF